MATPDPIVPSRRTCSRRQRTGQLSKLQVRVTGVQDSRINISMNHEPRERRPRRRSCRLRHTVLVALAMVRLGPGRPVGRGKSEFVCWKEGWEGEEDGPAPAVGREGRLASGGLRVRCLHPSVDL